MSIASVFFPVATIALAVACFACYKTSKPLRRKAHEEAALEAENKARQEREGREKSRRDQLRIEIFSELEQAIATPERTLCDNRYGSGGRGASRWKYLNAMIETFRNQQDVHQRTKFLEDRCDELARSNRELRGQVKEIHRLLKPYA